MENNTSNIHSIFSKSDIVHTVTRADLLSEGALIDVTNVAKEAGFLFPVAVTESVWNESVKWDDKDSKRQCSQSESERLWDVLYMAVVGGRMHSSSTEYKYEFYRIPRGGYTTESALKQLKVNLGPGDKGEPVITIMQMNED